MRHLAAALALLAITFVAGCDRRSADPSELDKPATAAAGQPAAGQPAAGQPAAGDLPAGHPPTGDMPAGHPPAGAPGGADLMGVPPPPPGTGTGATGMTWTAPEGWQAETPANAMRKAQFKITGDGGDAELVVYYFGPGQGGDPLSNAQRWAGQFTVDGKPATDKLKTATKNVGDIEVLTVEVEGTYSGGMMGSGAPLENQMLLGAIAKGADANWFFKLTGPKATVEGSRAKFDSFIGSLKTGG